MLLQEGIDYAPGVTANRRYSVSAPVPVRNRRNEYVRCVQRRS